jgi:hypothetical protein
MGKDIWACHSKQHCLLLFSKEATPPSRCPSCHRRPWLSACRQRELSKISWAKDFHHASTAWFAVSFQRCGNDLWPAWHRNFAFYDMSTNTCNWTQKWICYRTLLMAGAATCCVNVLLTWVCVSTRGVGGKSHLLARCFTFLFTVYFMMLAQ